MNEDELRVRTYYLWEAAGRPDGQAERHWEQASRDAVSTAGASPSLVAEHSSDVLSAENRTRLERDILPGYLLERCWFASKNQAIRSLRIVEAAPIDDGGDIGVLAQIEVAFDNGVERYALPFALHWNDDDGSGTEKTCRSNWRLPPCTAAIGAAC